MSNDFSGGLPDDLKEFLESLQDTGPSDDQIEEIIQPYLEHLEEITENPEQLLQQLQQSLDQVNGALVQLLDEPGEESFMDLASRMAEWSLPAVAVGYCVSTGYFGDPNDFENEIDQLSGGMAKMQLTVLRCLHQDTYSSDTVTQIAGLWMANREVCQELVKALS